MCWNPAPKCRRGRATSKRSSNAGRGVALRVPKRGLMRERHYEVVRQVQAQHHLSVSDGIPRKILYERDILRAGGPASVEIQHATQRRRRPRRPQSSSVCSPPAEAARSAAKRGPWRVLGRHPRGVDRTGNKCPIKYGARSTRYAIAVTDSATVRAQSRVSGPTGRSKSKIGRNCSYKRRARAMPTSGTRTWCRSHRRPPQRDVSFSPLRVQTDLATGPLRSRDNPIRRRCGRQRRRQSTQIRPDLASR